MPQGEIVKLASWEDAERDIGQTFRAVHHRLGQVRLVAEERAGQRDVDDLPTTSGQDPVNGDPAVEQVIKLSQFLPGRVRIRAGRQDAITKLERLNHIKRRTLERSAHRFLSDRAPRTLRGHGRRSR